MVNNVIPDYVTSLTLERPKSYSTWADRPIPPGSRPARLSNIIRSGAMAIFLASPLTVGGLEMRHWWESQRTSSVIGTLIRPLARRRISLAQARRMALEIMTQADTERLRAADLEATQGAFGEV